MKVDLDKLTIEDMFNLWDIFKTELIQRYHVHSYIDYAICAILQHLNYIPVEDLSLILYDIPKGKRLYSRTAKNNSFEYILRRQGKERGEPLEIDFEIEANYIEFRFGHIRDVIRTHHLNELNKIPEYLYNSVGEYGWTEKEKTLEFREELNNLFKECLGKAYNVMSGMDNLYSQIEKIHSTQLQLDKIMKGQ